jgi:hypothetical protein
MTDELEKLEKTVKKVRKDLKDQKKEFSSIIDAQKDYTERFFEKFEHLLNQQEKEFEDKLKTQEKEFSDLIQAQKDYINKLEQNVDKSIRKLVKNIDSHKMITKDMINELKEEFLRDKNELESKFEELQAQQDVLKISYTINEKKLIEKVKEVIREDVKEAVKGQEREILMNVWIEELKKIIADFEQLKQLKPKEFEMQLDEICSTIDLFKKKLL